MILYITDNPNIKKTIPGCILLYQIFDWKVSINKDNILEEDFKISKKFKLDTIKKEFKINSHIVAILNRSNYKLMYELLHINKKVTFYYWDNYLSKQEIKPSLKETEFEFNKYLQRGFLSSILYEKLSAMNLQRVEQFLIIISVIVSNKKDISNTLIPFKTTNFRNAKYSYDLFDLFNSISIKKENPIYVIDKLIYHSRKIDITDPFAGKFTFKNKNNSLWKLYKENNKKPNTNLTNEVIKIHNLLIKIIPSSDILKTLRFLFKNDILSYNGNIIYQNLDLKFSQLKESIKYIDNNKWNIIYKDNGFDIFNIFPPLKLNELKFECPLCGSKNFRSSPFSYWCSDNLCSFRINRVINPVGIKKKITEWDLCRLIKHNSTIIKNSNGGYSRFYLLENEKYKGKFHILPYIESNDINPDSNLIT